jgi:trehalose synthase
MEKRVSETWQPQKLTLNDYVPIIGQDEVDMLRRLAKHLRGRTVVHLNSTRSGGGVAEILTRLVPLMLDVDLDVRWEVIRGDESFFKATKTFHNTLQGHLEVPVTDDLFDCWLRVNQENMQEIDTDVDYVWVHDPQPAAFIDKRKPGSHWAWRCHIDVSTPHPKVWGFLRPWIEKYDTAIFSMNEFAPELSIREALFRPCIDPLSEKNIELSDEEVASVYGQFGIELDRPIILQVSRYDRFKDPVGVIEAYKLVKRHHDCVLVLAGGTATDDPEGIIVLQEVKEAAGNDPDVHILALPPADRIINALQRGATVVMQKSLREGFGLTVAEALWKGKPVIGGNAGGIAAQVQNGHTGFLVNSIEGAAYWTRYLLEHADARRHLGEVGREHVRRNFLMTQTLKNYVTMMLILERQAHGLLHLD